MPRAPRLQFKNALYHLINRGNYRQDAFAADSTRMAFQKCLFEACEKAGWLLYAYVIMRNHFHLAVRTPRANLVEGMHWLESTFAARFNRFRKENGHLFQGRYKAILIEPGFALAGVVNYIHLNPAKARVVPVVDLGQFAWSSFHQFQRHNRPEFMSCADWLFELGGLKDSKEGWKSYHEYLMWLAANDAEQKRQAFDTLCRGWAVGSKEWRGDVVRDQKQVLAAHALRGGEGAAELKELMWARALDEMLSQAERRRLAATNDRKGASWKIALAVKLKQSTTATNTWIGRELRMGTGDSVSVYLCKHRRQGKN